MAEAAKVGFWALGEYETTAYLDEWEGPDGLRRGSHKHSGEALLLRWDDRRSRWVEVDAVELVVRVLTLHSPETTEDGRSTICANDDIAWPCGTVKEVTR